MSLFDPVGGNVRVKSGLSAVGRRLALLAVDKVVRGDGLPYSFGSPRYFPNNDDYVRRFPDLLRQRIIYASNYKVTGIYWNLEYETDLAGAKPPFSRVTQLHGRTVKPVVSNILRY